MSDEPGHQMPEPSFAALIDVLAAPALIALGAYAPQGESPKVDLGHARFTIELLRILRERTATTRSDDETKRLDELLDGLQRTFVAVKQQEERK